MTDEPSSTLSKILKRLATLETDALRIRRDLDLQFQRIAQIQAQMDLLAAPQPPEDRPDVDKTRAPRQPASRPSKRPTPSTRREH